MAMSGTRPTSAELAQISHYLYVQYDWSVTFDTSNMKANWVVSATIKQNPTSPWSKNFATKIKGHPDYIKFNNTTVWSMSEGGTSYNPYAYTGDASVCADKVSTVEYDSGEFKNTKPRGYSHLLINKSFQTDIDINGNTSLAVSSQLTGGYPRNILSNNAYTFVPDQADLYTKIPHKTSGGWENGYIWYKDPSNGWIKKYLYRRESGQWVKK